MTSPFLPPAATRPKVSVLLLTYNQAAFLRDAVDSILDQTFRDFELIIINDCSPDNTREVLADYEGRPQVCIIHHETNMGLQRSTQEAIELSRGEYILWTAGDDFHRRRLLEHEAKMLDEHPNAGFVYCSVYSMAEDGHISGLRKCPDKPELSHDYVRPGLQEFAALLSYNHVMTTGAVLFRRACYDQVGGIDFALPESSDWDLWLRMSLVADVAHLAAPLFCWRRHEGTLTHRMHKSGQYHLDHIRVLEKTRAHLPPRAVGLAETLHKLLAKAYLTYAWSEYERGVLEEPNRARARRHWKRARAYLFRAWRGDPGAFRRLNKIKLAGRILLRPTPAFYLLHALRRRRR